MSKSKSILFFYSLFILAFVFISSVSCKKKTETPVQETGTVTDVDNNTYKTVKIGNQWWMAENLRVKHYRNGKTITQFDGNGSYPDSLWTQTTKGACCIFGYANAVNSLYGLLYNWYVVSDTNIIAPAGWHVPSDDEWKTLETYLGMSQADANNVKWRGNDEGDKLKIQAPTDWQKGNGWGTNTSGFMATAASCRLFDATWGTPGLTATGFWWSTSIHTSDNQVWYRYLDHNNSNVFRYHASKNYGMSIRCVKD
jgi:uncharacterized protein (TIGR02145 family)